MGEKELSNSNNLFKALYDDSPIGIELYDSSGNLIDLNQSCMELFGVLSKDDVKGFDLLNDPNIPEEQITKLKQRETVKYEIIFDFDLVNKHKLYDTIKSGKIYLDVLITPLFLGENKSISNYIVHIQDISNRKAEQHKLIDLNEELEIRAQEKTKLLRKSDITWSKKSEEKIQYQAKLVENVSDAIISTDFDFRIITWNKAAELIYGWKAEEIVGKKVMETITIEYPYDDPKSVVNQVFEEGSWKGEVIQPRKDGTPINILASVSLIKDITGVPIGVVAINHDITERKKAEKKIQESEKQLKDLIEAVPVGISITSPEGKIEECNSSAFQFFGYNSKEDFLKNPVMNYYYNPSDRDKFMRLLEQGLVKDFETQFIREGGSIFWASLTSIAHKVGAQTNYINSFQDITERKATEIKIQQSEAELSAIYNYTPMAILLVDNERRIRKINKFALQFTDRQEEEVFGIHGGEALRCLYSIKDPKGCGFSEYCHDCTIRNTVLDTFRSRSPYINIEATLYLLPDCEVNKVHLLFSTVPLNVGGEDRVLISMVDITERKKAEEKLKESEERFKYLVSSSPAIIYTSKISGNYGATFISDNVQNKWGYSSEAFISNSDFWLNHVHPDDKEYVLSILSDLLEKEYIMYDYRFKLNDGTYHWMHDEVELLKDTDGNPIETIGSVIDITERKIADHKLRESEEKYRSFIENFQGIAFQGYRDFSAAFFHGNVQEITGYIEDDFISGRITWDNIIHPEDSPIVNEKVRIYHESSTTTDKREYRIVNKDHNTKWIIEYNQKFYDPLVGKDGVRGVIIDNTKYKTAEYMLKESEEKYRRLFDNAPFAIVLFNIEGYILDCNKATTLITGYKKEELIGNDFKDFNFYVNNETFNLEERQDQIEMGTIPLVSEVLLYKKDGSQFWARSYLEFIRLGKETYLQGIIQDITNQKIAEMKLKESEEKYRYISNQYKMLLESITDGVYALNREWEYILVNENAEKLVNMPIEKLLGKKIFEVFPSIEQTPFFKTYNSVMNTGNAERVTNSFKLPDGQIGYYEVSVYPIQEGILCIGKDVTEEKEIERKLKESEEKFRTIAEQSSLGLIIQQDGFIKFANSAVSDIIEHPLEEIHKWTAENTLKFIYKEDLQFIIEKLKQRQNGDFKAINHYECRAITESGKIKWIDVYTKPIIYHGKNAVLSTFIDITEKKKVEEELKEISRLKSELLSRTSHELKTPLVSIKGYADLLLTQHYEELDFYTISMLHEIKQGCSRLESLIKDLLETSKLESGEIHLIKTKEDLAFLIRFCVKDLKGLVETRNHELILDINDEMMTFFEKERIYEVVMNLISNAIKYTPENGKITIRSEIQNGNYVVSVQDTGIGLTDEEKTKIFKKFGKVERYGQGLDVISEGTGLGLYISKKIIELHEGNMWVESEGRKQGSMFYFSLPIIKK